MLKTGDKEVKTHFKKRDNSLKKRKLWRKKYFALTAKSKFKPKNQNMLTPKLSNSETRKQSISNWSPKLSNYSSHLPKTLKILTTHRPDSTRCKQ